MIQHEFKGKCVLKQELSDLPMIRGSASQLNQVFMNLLNNAFQAIEKEGIVTVSTNMENNNIIIKISDTGNGIAKENLEKLFEPFFTTKSMDEGTGIGLSISYDIVKKYGGDILVSSISGEGSVFEVRLPIEGPEIIAS